MTPNAAPPDEEALRAELCRVGALAYERGYICGTEGNLSARLSDGTLLVTPAGAMKGFLEPEQLVRLDRAGRVLGRGQPPSTELGIHLVCYAEREDVRAVVHAHPVHAVALSVAGIDLEQPLLPEVVVTLGGVPTAPYATPGTSELAESLRALVRRRDAVLLKNHGVVTVGSGPLAAFQKLETVEHFARVVCLAHALVERVEPLPDAALRELLESRRRLFESP